MTCNNIIKIILFFGNSSMERDTKYPSSMAQFLSNSQSRNT